ncbi:hypothetical protein M885DRAFT_11642 [Pelagophyceae sp. CCMP2097]|nr:hypothetical protein M885DRAFT_11642 [Pelagophyceae sp. CCMP2097]
MDPMEYEDEDDESTASPPQTLADGSRAIPRPSAAWGTMAAPTANGEATAPSAQRRRTRRKGAPASDNAIRGRRPCAARERGSSRDCFGHAPRTSTRLPLVAAPLRARSRREMPASAVVTLRTASRRPLPLPLEGHAGRGALPFRRGALPFRLGVDVHAIGSWLAAHFAYPYPAPHEQAQLLQDTGIEKKQLKNWLTNARRRTWRESKDQRVLGPLLLREGLAMTSKSAPASCMARAPCAECPAREPFPFRPCMPRPLRRQGDGPCRWHAHRAVGRRGGVPGARGEARP